MNRKKHTVALALALALVSAQAEKPFWWDNPHRDDATAMYERGKAEGAKSEQDATREAVNAAKEMLVGRIGIVAALDEAGISPSPEFAIVNFETVNVKTERAGKKWTAWVLIKYSQDEKQRILDRWNASIASIKELKKHESLIPTQFGLTLKTADGLTAYRSGDSLSFTVTAERDCYLMLLDHQSDGTTVLLFPNRFQSEGMVKKGQTVTIPLPSDPAFRFIVGAPYGDDRIEAIASTAKSSLYGKFADMILALPANQDVAVTTRGIFVSGLGDAMAKESDILWSRAEITLSTFAK
jgi:Domain of unknown function (DUF4384)